MPTSTAWRRRPDERTRRAVSPLRITNEHIERITPDRDIQPHYQTYATYSSVKREQHVNRYSGLGLGLSSPSVFVSGYDGHSDRLYIDQDGEAHIGTKLRPSQYDRKRPDKRPQSSRTPRNSSNSWQTSRPKNHTRSGSNLEDLANIAAAISPQLNSDFAFLSSAPDQMTRPNTSYIKGYTHDGCDRPSKRARSERTHTSEWIETGERPKTSHTIPTQRTQEDLDAAEMMVGLSGRDVRITHSAPVEIVKIEALEPQSQVLDQTSPGRDSTLQSNYAATTGIAVQANAAWDTPIDDKCLPPEPSLKQVNTQSFNEVDADAPQVSVQQPPKYIRVQDTGSDGARADVEAEVKTETNGRPPPIQAPTGTVELEADEIPDTPLQPVKKQRRVKPETLTEDCALCHKPDLSNPTGETTTPWLGCEACKRWFHLPCAGFKDQQEVQAVDKYICKDCTPTHGETTFVRKSSRPRHAIDYAGLNEGVVKSSAVTTMHHYVPKFKDGSIAFRPDDFARIKPELLTEELWENMTDKRPFVVPACWNPRFGRQDKNQETVTTDTQTSEIASDAEPSLISADKYETVIDLDQDYLDMVMPQNLTVQKVAELYGPDEPVPVIDVKSQGEKGKFTLQQWADYYDAPEKKQIRNVISLEVSNSRLGRLIRRPKVVRDIDLEDQVWDAESRQVSNKKPVQFYCLMSVEDSYTDFHIDFGGSSVYYHILKGVKTFFFIPPEERYLKRYEDWCLSDTQSETWLGDLCNGNVTRVDLYEGDTAFIPAGWIHSVWTPKDSLVIGGNFLTRYDLEMQIKVQQIEKVTKVPPRYRYPFFQKVMWYTMIKYLEDDPVPEHIIEEFKRDPEYRYLRANPIWKQHLAPSPSEEPDDAEYNARHYSRNELGGLLALRDFIYRTARIYADLPVDNPPNKKQTDSVRASIPKQYGDPLQLVCLFAVWCAWKLGNIAAPDWIHAEHEQQELEKQEEEEKQKKVKKIHIPGERSSTRTRRAAAMKESTPDRASVPPPGPASDAEASVSGIKVSIDARLGVPRIACESCRKRRTKCRHQDPPTPLDETAQETLEKSRSYSNVTVDVAKLARASPVVIPARAESSSTPPSSAAIQPVPNHARQASVPTATVDPRETTPVLDANTDLASAVVSELTQTSLPDMNSNILSRPPVPLSTSTTANGDGPGSAKKGRSKACEECRKSKRRCVHDEYGRIDPAKAAEPSKPRGSSTSKRPMRLSDEHMPKRFKSEYSSHEDDYAVYSQSHSELDAMIDPALLGYAQPSGLESRYLQQPLTDVATLSMPPDRLSEQDSKAIASAYSNQWTDSERAAMIAAQAQQMLSDPQSQQPSLLALQTTTNGTPEHDKSFSPITAETVSADTPIADGAPQPTNDSSAPDRPSNSNSPRDTGLNTTPTINGGDEDGSSRRRSSLTATTSPKQEATSSISRRSSSQTSRATNAGNPQSTIVPSIEKPAIQQRDENKSISEINSEDGPKRIQRSGTAASRSSEHDEEDDEKMARELQAQEHGLRRRRGSLRAS